MTQTLYAHMNKRNKISKKVLSQKLRLVEWLKVKALSSSPSTTIIVIIIIIHIMYFNRIHPPSLSP
jgi:hypothetical protein